LLYVPFAFNTRNKTATEETSTPFVAINHETVENPIEAGYIVTQDSDDDNDSIYVWDAMHGLKKYTEGCETWFGSGALDQPYFRNSENLPHSRQILNDEECRDRFSDAPEAGMAYLVTEDGDEWIWEEIGKALDFIEE